MQAEMNPASYPSIDRIWLKYYSVEAVNGPLPECTIYEYLWESNKDHLGDISIIYFGRKITYNELFKNIDKAAQAFAGIGVKKNDIVILCTLNTPEMIYCTYALNRIGAVPSFEYPTLSDRDMCNAIEKFKAKALVVLDIFIDKYHDACESVPYVISISPSESMSFITKVPYGLKNRRKNTALRTFLLLSSLGKLIFNQIQNMRRQQFWYIQVELPGFLKVWHYVMTILILLLTSTKFQA